MASADGAWVYCARMAEEFYTHGHDRVVVSAHATRTVADSAQFLLPRLEASARLLDFGCGPGSITVGLAEHVDSVVGVDSSAEAIAIAESNAAALNVEYLKASVYDLPLPDDSFDVAYGHQILQHLGDPVAALSEVRRVLKPGGLVAVRDSDFGTMTHHPRYAAIDDWLNAYRQVARANGGEPDAGRRSLEWVRSAGYVEPRGTASVWSYTTPQSRREWAELWANRILLPRFADRAQELQIADQTSLERMSVGWRRWAEEPDGWFGFIHGEVIAMKPGVV